MQSFAIILKIMTIVDRLIFWKLLRLHRGLMTNLIEPVGLSASEDAD